MVRARDGWRCCGLVRGSCSSSRRCQGGESLMVAASMASLASRTGRARGPDNAAGPDVSAAPRPPQDPTHRETQRIAGPDASRDPTTRAGPDAPAGGRATGSDTPQHRIRRRTRRVPGSAFVRVGRCELCRSCCRSRRWPDSPRRSGWRGLGLDRVQQVWDSHGVSPRPAAPDLVRQRIPMIGCTRSGRHAGTFPDLLHPILSAELVKLSSRPSSHPGRPSQRRSGLEWHGLGQFNSGGPAPLH